MASHRPTRIPARGWLLAFCPVLVLHACASSTVLVPPRLDLEPHGRVALVTFSAPAGHEHLAAMASERFVQEALASQPGVEIVELRAADLGLAGPLASADGEAIAEAVRRRVEVSAVFVGDLEVSGVKPHGGLGALGDGRVAAGVDAALAVRLLSTRGGGTLWRARSTASGSVGHASLAGGRPSLAVRDPAAAHAEVVEELVATVTRDLRPTRARR